MPRAGIPTGRVAVPVTTVTIPGGERTFISDDPRLGPTTLDVPDVTFRDPFGLGGIPIDTGPVAPLAGVSAMPMYSSGFSYGGFSPSTAPAGGMFGQILQAGTDIVTAIINRGTQTQQIPSMTGGTLPLPGTVPAPAGTIIAQAPAGTLPQTYIPRDVSLSAVAPAGGWPTTKDGRPRRVRRDGRPWKRPTMNPTNPRALGRAMRRVNGFAAVAKRTISFTKRVKMRKRKRT